MGMPVEPGILVSGLGPAFEWAFFLVVFFTSVSCEMEDAVSAAKLNCRSIVSFIQKPVLVRIVSPDHGFKRFFQSVRGFLSGNKSSQESNFHAFLRLHGFDDRH